MCAALWHFSSTTARSRVTSFTPPNLLPSGFIGSMPNLNRNVSLSLLRAVVPLSSAFTTSSTFPHDVHTATSPSVDFAAAAPVAASTRNKSPHASQYAIRATSARARARPRGRNRERRETRAG